MPKPGVAGVMALGCLELSAQNLNLRGGCRYRLRLNVRRNEPKRSDSLSNRNAVLPGEGHIFTCENDLCWLG
jgi:hypothetical protein